MTILERIARSACGLLAVMLLPALLHAQQPQQPRLPTHAHTLSGRVTSDSGAAVVGADIIVTVAPSAETFNGKSDSSGAYRLVVPAASATGEYLLYIGAVGRRPFRQRVTIAANDTAAIVNAKLASAVTALAGVQVQAQHPRPTASFGNDVGAAPVADGLNKRVDGVSNALTPDLQGNIDAMATLIPGLSVTSNGVSAFGMGADANMSSLNGMTFGGASVPRDLATTTTFFTSPWDPTRGGFSGALASTQVSRGSNVTLHSARVTLDAPALQATDPVARQFGQRYTGVQLSNSGSGAFSLDHYFYNYAMQASRTMAPVSSLLDLDPDALAHAGIAPDSAFRLTQILAARHIPLSLGGIPSSRTTTNVQYLERFDRALPSPRTAVPLPAWNLLVGGDYTESEAGALSPTTLPAFTGKTTSGGGFAQGQYTRYFGKDGAYVNELASGVSLRDNRGSPYLALPSGTVLIASSLADATPTVGALSFGGNGVLARDTRTVAWELTDQTDFLVNGLQSLPAKLYLQSRYEHFGQSVAANRDGAFSFASLNDLSNGVASSYTRTLNAPDRSGGEWLGAAALGGSYATTHFVLAGGARVDANAFTGLPAYDHAIDSAFHVRNDRAPNSIAVSPRFGVNWYPTGQRGLFGFGQSGASTLRSGYQFRGGIGEFRSFLPSNLLANAIGSTGLPGSGEQLVCTGPAAPVPDWQTYLSDPAAVPSTCAGGASVFSDAAPSVALVDAGFRPSRSWRATLGWTNGGAIGSLWGNYVAIDGVYSLNLDQPSTVDLNFAGVTRFTLPAEGNRPVFVSTGSVVPSTGSASAVESRATSAFGRVAERLSDLRSDTRQITVYTIPAIPFTAGIVTIGYTYSDSRTQARGFDGSTAADPRAIEWSAQPFTPRHSFVVQGARPLFGSRVILTAAGRFMSGLRYTPVVAGDVNGDGWSGDRAFVFDPARTADTAVARGLRDLLATGSRSARDCLSRQLNTIAGRSSCTGPWTGTLNGSVIISSLPRTHDRASASIAIANALGGLDQLLHGSDGLHGWGAVPLIDGTLYQTRSFDPVSRTYQYQVNPRFGSSAPGLTTLRAPFRLTLDVRVTYGRNPTEQQLELNLRIKPPLVGTRATADTIKARYLTGYTDPYKVMLRFADSLALSRTQVEAIEAQQKLFLPREDSLYTALAAYLVALPANYDVADGVKHVTDANDAAWQMVYGEKPFIARLLTAGQLRRLPFGLRDMMVTDNPKGRFFYGF